MIKTIKVMLVPNNKQKSKFFLFAGVSRFAYNWALEQEKKAYETTKKFISNYDLRKQFTELKQTVNYSWLYDVSNDVTKQAIKDACTAYQNFFSHKAKFPRFKSKKHTRPSFFVDNIKIDFTATHVKLEKLSNNTKRNRTRLNYVRLAEHNRIPTNSKYYNPRITFDGVNWFISVGVDVENSSTLTSKNEGVGIDLGLKDLAICSDTTVYKNINKTQKIKKLEKKKKRLQKQTARNYLNQRDETKKFKKGRKLVKSKNQMKREKTLLKVNHRLTNIRNSYTNVVTSTIIKREPSFICIEDLNVTGMMKNSHLSKAVQQQNFYEFRRQLEYKSIWNHIPLIIADRFYPSSKTCNCCGYVKKDLKLKDRTFVCPMCKTVIDRDYNASLNLRDYGNRKLAI